MSAYVAPHFATPGVLSHEDQSQLFTMVHAHWMKALSSSSPSVRMPLITSHLLNACLQRLGIESTQVGQIWVIGQRAPDDIVYNGLITGVHIPGSPVINYLGDRGWDTAQSAHAARLKSRQEESPHDSFWLDIEEKQVYAMLQENLGMMDLLRIEPVVSAVVSLVQQHWL